MPVLGAENIPFFRFHQLRNSYFFEEISRAIRTFSFVLFFLRIAFENSEEIVFKNRDVRKAVAKLVTEVHKLGCLGINRNCTTVGPRVVETAGNLS